MSQQQQNQQQDSNRWQLNAHSSSLRERGQAITEFAMIIVFLLMVIFIIVESARVMWAWVTVQNAAREASRYGITGQFDPAFQSDPNPRVSSIKNIARQELRGLRLNEVPNAAFEDDYYYLIEVYGVNEVGQLVRDDAGAPGKPLVVRVTYRVPIIVPLLNSIVESIPVFGQLVENNEMFGQLGGTGQSEGLPPPLPQVPTPGVTPSPTPTSTPTETPLPSITPSNTPTSTNTPTETPTFCSTRFEGDLIAGNNFLYLTGEIGETVEIIDLTTGVILGYETLTAATGHECPGFGDLIPNVLSEALVEGHIILAQSSNGSSDTAIVVSVPPTPTNTPTNTPTPTSTASPTPTITPSPTPSTAYIWTAPSCLNPNQSHFTVLGNQWEPNASVSLFFEDQLQSIVTASASGVLPPQNWSFPSLPPGIYTIKAHAPGTTKTTLLEAPCPDYQTPTPFPTPTATPQPIDLVINGLPTLMSSLPITENQPLEFAVSISNNGDLDVTDQLFVDIYFDSPPISTIAEYKFPSAGDFNSSDVNPYSSASALSALGGSLSTSSSSGNPAPSLHLTNDWDQSDFNGAKTNGDYIQFDVSQTAGTVTSLSSLSFDVMRNAADSLDRYALAADDNLGGGGDNYNTLIVSDTINSVSSWETKTIDLSTLSYLQNITSTFSFRLYLWGETGTNDLFIDNINLDGDATQNGMPANSIPISRTAGYTSLSFLGSQETRVVTITTFLGFTGGFTTHDVYSMVDSTLEILESNEDNNVSGPLTVSGIIPQPPPPPPTTTITGTHSISGTVLARLGSSGWVEQPRALVKLYDASSNLIASTIAGANGEYNFTGLAAGSYSVFGCQQIDSNWYRGLRINISTPPPAPVNVYLRERYLSLCP